MYSRRLKSFLVSKNVNFTRLNPYASAEGLAISHRKPTPLEDEIYLELRDWSRYYTQVNRDLIAHKCRLHHIL